MFMWRAGRTSALDIGPGCPRALRSQQRSLGGGWHGGGRGRQIVEALVDASYRTVPEAAALVVRSLFGVALVDKDAVLLAAFRLPALAE